MNAIAAEGAAAAIRDLGKDIRAEGDALFLASRRGQAAAAEIVKGVASVRKLAIAVERAAAQLLMAVEPTAKSKEDAHA